MLFMRKMIERKNIYLTRILPIPMNLIGTKNNNKKKSVWKRQLIFC
jgi:hypothetical protein